MLKVFTAGLLWGTIGLFVKPLSGAGLSPVQISLLRLFWCSVILLIFSLKKYGLSIMKLPLKGLIYCVLLGVISYGVFNISYTQSININGMGTACVLMYTAPVFTALASRLIYGERITKLKLFALVLNIAGCALTVTGGHIDSDRISFAGIIYGVCSGLCYGLAAVFGRLAGEYADSLKVSVNSYIYGLIFMLVIAVKDINAMHINGYIMQVSILYGLIPTAFAYMLYYSGVNEMKSLSLVPVIASIEPVAAVMLGRYIYGEALGAVNILGAVIVLLSIIIMMRSES